jgi:hypothetical protein
LQIGISNPFKGYKKQKEGEDMKTAKNLKEFTQEVIKYLGSGYKYAKVVQIPHKKRRRSHEIAKKVSEYYKTDLSRGKRQHRRRKNLANYGAVMFQDRIIVILRTSGEHNDNQREFKEVSKLEVELSEWLGLIFFKNEFDRWTVRVSRDTYRRIKADIQLAIKNNNGRNYHKLISMWRGLPWWKGIGRQSSELHRYTKELLKKYGRSWEQLYTKN